MDIGSTSTPSGPNGPDAGGGSDLPTRAQIIRDASQRVPLNGLGLPEGYHRADLLDPELVVKGRLAPITLDEVHRLAGSAADAATHGNFAARQVVQNQQRSPAAPDAPAAPSAGSPTPSEKVNLKGTPELSEDYRVPVLVLDERVLRQAYVPLNYDEGYPMLDEGHPFWQRLSYEPLDAYVAFQAYIEQGTSGSRQLFVLAERTGVQQRIAKARSERTNSVRLQERSSQGLGGPTKEFFHGSATTNPDGMTETTGSLDGSGFIQSASADPMRSGSVSVINGASHSELVDWFYLYHWAWRALAHDLFYVDSIKRSRDMQAILLENTHLVEANKIWDKLTAYINGDKLRMPTSVNADGDSLFWENMTPKVAIDLMKTLTHMQRVSLGMPAAAPSDLAILGGSGSGPAARSRRSSSTGAESGSSSASFLTGKAVRSGAAGSPQVNTSGNAANTGGAQPNAPDSTRSGALAPDDRTRRIATLLDRARARRAG